MRGAGHDGLAAYRSRQFVLRVRRAPDHRMERKSVDGGADVAHDEEMSESVRRLGPEEWRLLRHG